MRRALVAVALVGAVVAALAGRAVFAGRAALAAGDAAVAAGRPVDAIGAWEAAARWYLPGAGHVGEAYARLITFARAEPVHALRAWRAVRSAAHATRGLWTPHAEDLAAADAAIAQLSANDPDGALVAGDTNAARVAWHAARLAATSAARPGGGALALVVLGIAAWIAGAGWVIRRGIAGDGALQRRAALTGAVVSVLGIVVWAAGLYTA